MQCDLARSQVYGIGFVMIITADISVSDLEIQQRSFVWSKPACCLRCLHSLWGHGHVFSNGLFLKRYRCDKCKLVVTMKPAGRWPKYRSTITEIYESINHRLTSYRSLISSRRSRENHWLKKFVSFSRMLYGDSAIGSHLPEYLDFFFVKGIPFLG